MREGNLSERGAWSTKLSKVEDPYRERWNRMGGVTIASKFQVAELPN